MKIYMWYSFVQLFKNKLITMVTTVMLAIGLILVCHAKVTYARFHNSELMAEKHVDYSLDKIYNINFFKYIYAHNDEAKAIYELYSYIKQMPEVELCGAYYIDTELKLLYVSADMAKICGIDITSADDGYYAWVGFDIAGEYTVGSVIDDVYTDKECTIKGTVPKGSVFLSACFIDSSGDIVSLDDYIIMDFDKMIEYDFRYITNGFINNFYFYVPDSDDIEYVRQSIRDKAQDLDIDVYGINSFKQMCDKNSREAMENAGEDYFMPAIVLICSCIGIFIATMISYRLNKHDTNIMLANGFTRRNLANIFMFENIYKMLAAYLITIFYWNNNKDALEQAKTINIIPLMIWIGILGFLLMWLSSLPIRVRLKSKTPISLVGED